MRNYFNIKTLLLDKMSKLLGVTLTVDNCTLGNVKPYTLAGSDRNTSVEVTHAGVVHIINYNRLDLNVLANRPRPHGIYLDHKPTVYEMIPILHKYLGFNVFVEDFIDRTVDDEGDGMYSLLLEASPDSIRFTGSIEIFFRDLPGIEDNLLLGNFRQGYI